MLGDGTACEVTKLDNLCVVVIMALLLRLLKGLLVVKLKTLLLCLNFAALSFDLWLAARAAKMFDLTLGF